MPVRPVQLMAVAVLVGVGGTGDGVGVAEGGRTCVGVLGIGATVFPGTKGEVGVKVGGSVGVLIPISVGTLEGVLVSAAKAVGKVSPKIGTEIRNVRALAETISSGSTGMTSMIGS